MTSQIRVDEITNRSGLGTVTIYDNGFEFTGVTTFTEDVDITGGLTIGGVLTYEDVTNIDSVGVITARAGIRVTGGNLAVGHNNPSVNLHVKGSASNGQIYLGGTGAHSQIYADNDGVLILNADQGNSAANSYLGFNVDNSERLRVDSSGRLLIGRTSVLASSAERLTIDDGMAMFRRNNSNAAAVYIRNEDTTADTRQPYLIFTDGGGNRGGFGVQYNESSLWISGQNGIAFRTSGSAPSQEERLRITSAGDVGIGTDTPYVNNSFNSLSIGGSGKYGLIELNKSDGVAGSWIDVYGTNGNGDLRITTAGTSQAITFWTGGSFTEKVRITSDGKMGVGCTPEVDFQVRNANGGTLKIGGSGTGATGFQIQYNNSGNTTTEILTNYRSTSGSASLKLDTGTFLVATGTSGTERLRITSGGDVLIGGQTAYTYDDTGASNTILDVWNSGNNKRGILSLSGNTNGGSSIGTIWFNNDNNSGASPGNNMKLSAAIQSQAVTSDGNAGSDAGATLQFLTKPEGSPMVESMRITSIGDIYQRDQRVHTCLHAEYRQLSGSVNSDSVGGWVDIKNFGYTPKRAGSLIVCHFQVQTWNGSSSNMNGDIYFRARYDQGGGSYISVTYGGNNNRMTGNLDQDSNRQHLFYTHTFGFTASNTNSHTINLQASNGSSLSTDFNWFHTGDNANGCWIFEYDN